jgi:predicted deacylase
VIHSPTSGFLICMRAPCLTRQGDCVAVVAEEVDPSRLQEPGPVDLARILK